MLSAGESQTLTQTDPSPPMGERSGADSYPWIREETTIMMKTLTIRPLTSTDRQDVLGVINVAARWYQEFLPPEEAHDPEMTAAQWDAESQRMTWYGAFQAAHLVGVMALEYVREIALLRHAYILPEAQHQGIGSRLREHLEAQIRAVDRIVVGTYAGNYKARGALEKAGYRLSANSEAMLRAYYEIPEDRLQSSVSYEKDL